MKKDGFFFYDVDLGLNPSSEDYAKTISARLGIIPRKKGATESMHKVLIELYERRKISNKEKRPELAIMTVEEMGMYAGIKRQTMYDYLNRWLRTELIKKSSYIKNGKIIKGYMLNGTTLEDAFNKVVTNVNLFLEKTKKMISEFQKKIKNEKISSTMKKENGTNR